MCAGNSLSKIGQTNPPVPAADSFLVNCFLYEKSGGFDLYVWEFRFKALHAPTHGCQVCSFACSMGGLSMMGRSWRYAPGV